MPTQSNNPDPLRVAVPLSEPPHRRRWALPLILALAALLVLALLLSRCGDDDPADPTTAPATSAGVTPATPAATGSTPGDPSAGTATGTTAGAAAGTVMAGTDDLLRNPTAAGLAGHADGAAVATSAPVQSVPADEGFWVGNDDRDRLWVQLTGLTGESIYKVKAGDRIDFTGTVTRAPAKFAADHGVTAAEGADQLTEQGHFISVPAVDVRLSR